MNGTHDQKQIGVFKTCRFLFSCITIELHAASVSREQQRCRHGVDSLHVGIRISLGALAAQIPVILGQARVYRPKLQVTSYLVTGSSVGV